MQTFTEYSFRSICKISDPHGFPFRSGCSVSLPVLPTAPPEPGWELKPVYRKWYRSPVPVPADCRISGKFLLLYRETDTHMSCKKAFRFYTDFRSEDRSQCPSSPAPAVPALHSAAGASGQHCSGHCQRKHKNSYFFHHIFSF